MRAPLSTLGFAPVSEFTKRLLCKLVPIPPASPSLGLMALGAHALKAAEVANHKGLCNAKLRSDRDPRPVLLLWRMTNAIWRPNPQLYKVATPRCAQLRLGRRLFGRSAALSAAEAPKHELLLASIPISTLNLIPTALPWGPSPRRLRPAIPISVSPTSGECVVWTLAQLLATAPERAWE